MKLDRDNEMAKVSLKAWGQVLKVDERDKKTNEKTGKKKIIYSKKNPEEQAVEVKWSVEVFENVKKSASFNLPIWNKIVENPGMEVTANSAFYQYVPGQPKQEEFPARKATLQKNGSGNTLIVTTGNDTQTFSIPEGEAEAILIASKNRLFINEERNPQQ